MNNDGKNNGQNNGNQNDSDSKKKINNNLLFSINTTENFGDDLTTMDIICGANMSVATGAAINPINLARRALSPASERNIYDNMLDGVKKKDCLF